MTRLAAVAVVVVVAAAVAVAAWWLAAIEPDVSTGPLGPHLQNRPGGRP